MASSKAIGHQHASPSHRARSVPIGDYGFLSDGEVCALLAPGGSVDWMCVPRFDSGSIFGRMLGPHAGSFRISPVDVEVPADVRYLPGTMIVETSWGTATGWIVVRDCAADGSLAARGDAVEDPPPDSRTTTTPSTSCCGPSAASPARCRW